MAARPLYLTVMEDIVLLTEDKYEHLSQSDDGYIRNVLKEDQLVQEALEAKGLRVKKVSWSNPNFDWKQCRLALFRTTWDYFHRFEAFDAWLNRLGSCTETLNPIEQIRWNMDKHYLKDLANEGINTTPTVFIEPNTETSLLALHQEHGWEQTVLKPAISGAARHTYKLNRHNLAEHEGIFQELIQSEALLLQPFQEYVLHTGEVSHMVFGGKYTHSVLKVAKPGDFRVQDDFGGTLHDYSPSEEEISFAETAVQACHPIPAYARVDVIRDNDGHLAIQELELIEPELWFRRAPNAANRLAEVIEKHLVS